MYFWGCRNDLVVTVSAILPGTQVGFSVPKNLVIHSYL